ncbi:hypothetical protein [Paraburkholderia sp. JPY465]|uniref:hypothetical protein n=1 Tax=Paraburkholderia sp. JPY465 TaxID=3042285 RepID=UPI003D23F370
MCGVIGQRIALLAAAIHGELHRPAPDAQRVELLELQQARLRRIRDEVRPDDARAIARHIAHFGRIGRGNDDRRTRYGPPLAAPHSSPEASA